MVGVERKIIDVQLQCVRSGFFDALGIFHPTAVRDAVQAADDGDADGVLEPFEVFEIFFRSQTVAASIRQVGERFGKGIGAVVQEMVQFEAFVDDLLFEQRIHHDGADAGLFHLFDGFNLFRQGGCGCNQRVFQFRPR